MERAYSPDERIRRAEEIYARRQNLRERTKKARLSVDNSKPKNFKLFKKLGLQIAICVLIYAIFYLIKTTNYTFSEEAINRTKEVLSYDIDFVGLYNKAVEWKDNFLHSENQNIKEEAPTVTPNEEIKQEASSVEIAEVSTSEEESLTQSEIKETEQSETDRIKSTYSFIAPVTGGVISSEFGEREVNASVITAYHKGIDIAVDTGTKIVAATEGEVVIARSSASYGNYVMIQNNEIKTVYAHCSKLLVNVRR